MEIKVESDSKHQDESKQPLLQDISETVEKTLIQKAISQTFQSTPHLANLLPTGSVLAFQLLSPIFTNQGICDPTSRFMTAALVTLCGVSCFVRSFTDSFRDKKGNIFYGFATTQGLWVIDGSATLSPELAANYRLRFIDFMHDLMSILVFVAVALFDKNVVSCFFPTPSDETQEILTQLELVPLAVCCLLRFLRSAMELASPSLQIKDNNKNSSSSSSSFFLQYIHAVAKSLQNLWIVLVVKLLHSALFEV